MTVTQLPTRMIDQPPVSVDGLRGRLHGLAAACRHFRDECYCERGVRCENCDHDLALTLVASTLTPWHTEPRSFDHLVDAVRDAKLCAEDPDGWCDAHDIWPAAARARVVEDTAHEVLVRLDVLLAGAPEVRL